MCIFLSQQLVGRDKVLRFVQYLARFLSYYLFRKGYSAKALVPWNSIKAQFGMARKLMRVGKNVEHLKEAGRLAGTKNVDPVLRYVWFFLLIPSSPIYIPSQICDN